ncbi:MAG TPA: AbrB/MazE/SpoVT family DNA-binding domain-containing protein [Blastocatellia bacterium]|nr:AbrB/MazE/SpoVT family DNA-binding domain-containing protein [Blastocatellia bacterium]
MAQSEKNFLEITRLGNDGEVTLPASYRDSEHLSPGAVVALVQVGDALVVAPMDAEFASVVGRLESTLQSAGASIEDIITAAAAARSEIVLEEFGSKDND